MGNQLSSSQSSEEINRLLLGLENFTQEGQPLEANKLFTIVKLSPPDSYNLLLAKVFVKNKDLDISSYKLRFEDLSIRMSNLISPNLLLSELCEFNKIIILLRQYCEKTLRKKLITPPFLNSIEKMWLSYQCLLAVKQLHDGKVFHGDIKTENFLTTSWNWLFLTDVSSFYKPNYIAEGDLTSYKLFFAYSERPACYMSPEKFSAKGRDEPLTGEMDIFSLGCVIAEIFLDGQCLFTLPELLSYKRMILKTPAKLNEIKNENIQKMVSSMIALNPEERKSIDFYIKQWETTVLPQDMIEIYPFVLELMIEKKTQKSPWSKILAVSNFFYDSQVVFKNPEVLVILADYITGHIRNVCYPEHLVRAIELLSDIGAKLSDDSKLHRILPFLVNIVQNKQERNKVKVSCINHILRVLDGVREISARDSHLFKEYVWTALSVLIHDESDWVRAELARSLPHIAKVGRVFFEASLSHIETKQNYEKELAVFTGKFVRIFKELIVSKPECQVQTELLSNFAELAQYLETRSVVNNIIPIFLSWLNKGDAYRLLVLSQIPKLIQIIHTPEFFNQIFTYIEDGLTLHNELVVFSTLQIFQFADQLGEPVLSNVLLGLRHPSQWVRNAVIGIVRTLIKKMQVYENYSILRSLAIDYIDLPAASVSVISDEVLECIYRPYSRKEFTAGDCQEIMFKKVYDAFRSRDTSKPPPPTQVEDRKYPILEIASPSQTPLFSFPSENTKSLESLSLKGNLQGCFNEHECSVTHICIVESSQSFISASSDGSLKLWSLEQLEPFKPIHSQPFPGLSTLSGKIRSIGSCGDTFYVAQEDGISLGPLNSLTMQQGFPMSKLVKAAGLSENTLMAVDQQGLMCIYDIRQGKPAQKHKVGSNYGLVSSLCKGPTPSTLALGTFSSALMVYDLRFACPSIILFHSSGLPILTMQSYGASSLLAGGEDIALLDLHSSTVTVVLAAFSPSPVVVPSFRESMDNEWVVKNCYNISHRTRKTFENQTTVRKLISPCPPFVISGGNDCLIRCWDLANPSKCFTIGQDPALKSKFKELSYPDVKAIQEDPYVPNSGYYSINKSLRRKEYIEMPIHRKCSHTDAILDIALLTQPRQLLLTASRDGTIKAWN